MSHQQLILNSSQSESPERLQRAICGLADGSYHVYVTEQDSEHVRGSVINGDGKEYAVSIGDGFLSCACPDFGYRRATYKHILALALRILQTEAGVVEQEQEEQPVNLKLTKTRPGWQGCA